MPSPATQRAKPPSQIRRGSAPYFIPLCLLLPQSSVGSCAVPEANAAAASPSRPQTSPPQQVWFQSPAGLRRRPWQCLRLQAPGQTKASRWKPPGSQHKTEPRPRIQASDSRTHCLRFQDTQALSPGHSSKLPGLSHPKTPISQAAHDPKSQAHKVQGPRLPRLPTP